MSPVQPELIVDGRSDCDLLDVLGAALPRMQRTARLLVGSGPAAEDLLAEAMARTLPRWRRGAVDDVAGYLHRVMLNLAVRGWKRRRLGARLDHAALDWLPNVPRTEDDSAERDRVLRAVLSLPARRRAVVVLRFYDDLSEAAIADTLGISAGTVKSQLSRGLKQLRGELGTLEGS